MDFSSMITKLQSTINIKKEIRSSIESVLTSLGIDISTFNYSFRNYADIIYSIGPDLTDLSKVIKFVQSDYNYSNAEVDSISSTFKKINNLNMTKIWIKNALRTRQIDTTNLLFSEFNTAILSITSDTECTPLLTMISGESESYKETEIVIDGTLSEGESYLYKKTENIPFLNEILDDTWRSFNDTVEAVNGEFICVCLVDSSKTVKALGLVQASVRERQPAGELTITAVAGEDYNTTSLTIDPVLTSGRKYYYKIYNNEEFMEEDIVDLTDYEEWDGTSDIVFTYAGVENTNYLLIEVNEDIVVNYGIFKPVLKKLPEWYVELNIASSPGTLLGATTLTIYPEKSEDSKYYYKEGIIFDTKLDLTNFSQEGYTEWDGTTDISLENGISIYLVEVSTDNKVLRGGSTVINVRKKSLEYLSISSVEGTKANETILTISPTIESGNKYIYKESDLYTYPQYDELIDTTYYEEYDPESSFIIEDGTRIIIIEVSSDNKARKAGYVTVQSKKPYIESLLIDSVEGEVTGYTKLNVSPEKENLNIYVYMKGITPLKYDQDVSSLTYWDGSSEINGFENDDIITVVECTSGYKARKSGSVSAVVKGVELIIFTLFTYKGQKGGCTLITVSNSLKEGDKYKYSFVDSLPELYQDLSTWSDWDGESEIPATNGDTICIAEVNSSNQAIGAGIIEVKAKDPDPVLESLTLTLSESSKAGYRYISVLPELGDGYKYKYSFTDILPDYGEDLSSWADWDGTSDINFGTNVCICIAECTIDNFARKGGIAQNI